MKIKSLIKIITITLALILITGTLSFATSTTGATVMSLDEMAGQISSFEQMGASGQKITVKEAITAFLPIGRILVAFATITLVVVGLIMGVKYMISGANDKAQMKEKLIYYVIAVVLVYGATGIFAMVVAIMNNILG